MKHLDDFCPFPLRQSAHSLGLDDLHYVYPNWNSVSFAAGTHFPLTAVLTAPWNERPHPMEEEACLQHLCSHAMPTAAATYSKGPGCLNVSSGYLGHWVAISHHLLARCYTSFVTCT